jgi:serine/threonine protein kinase
LVSHSIQAFARKIVRLTPRVSQDEINNETRAVAAIRAANGHENVVAFLDHGWLRGSHRCYFIDMELADFALADYLGYFREKPTPDINIDNFLHASGSALVHRDSPYLIRMQNMWCIGSHIAKGLRFIHSLKYVHRDLKPSNGANPAPRL